MSNLEQENRSEGRKNKKINEKTEEKDFLAPPVRLTIVCTSKNVGLSEEGGVLVDGDKSDDEP